MSQDNVFTLHPNSIVAVSIRGLMERYGRRNIGILWALVEPMILAIGVMILWSSTKGNFEHGVPVLTMVFTGYLPLTLWRHITGPATQLYVGGFSLLYHRSISLVDILVAKILAEFAATTTAALLILFVLRVFGLINDFERFDLVIGGWLLMAWMSAGALCLMASFCAMFHWLEKFFLAFQYLLIPLSGCFFLLEWMPTQAAYYLSFNPLIHSYEMVREGFIGSYVTTHFSAWYGFLAGAVMFVIGFALLPRVREELSGH